MCRHDISTHTILSTESEQRIYVSFAQAKYKVNVIVQIQAHNRVRIYDKHRHWTQQVQVLYIWKCVQVQINSSDQSKQYRQLHTDMYFVYTW